MKKPLLTLILFLIVLFSYSQERLKHDSTYFVNSKGQYHIQEHQPVYLFISNKPEGKDVHHLTSETTPKHANPMYLDGHGKHYIRHLDYDNHYHEREVVFEIYADGIAPKSKLNFAIAAKHTANGKVFYGPGLSVDMTTTDEMSGIKTKYISVNGQAYSPYSSAIPFTKEGEHSLKAYAVDNVGNAENSLSNIFTLDITTPTTNIIYTGPKVIVSKGKSESIETNSNESSLNKGDSDNTPYGSQTVIGPKGRFTLAASDNLSGVKNINFAYDGADKTYPYVGKDLYIAWMNEGAHSLDYFSKDNVLNKEKKHSYDFYLDKTAPIIDVEVKGDKYIKGTTTYVSDRTRIVLSATDNKAGVDGVFYTFGNNFAKYNHPLQVDRNVYMKTYGVDKVENKGAAKSANTLFHLDNTPPTISSKYVGPQFFTRDTMFIREITKVKLSGWDQESGLESINYSLNNGNNIKYSESFTVTKKGKHNVKYTGKDNVNNEVSKNITFIVDNEAPVIHTHFGSNPIGKKKVREVELTIYSRHSKLYLAATDKAVGTDKIYYSINGAAEVLYTKEVKYFKAGKNYKIDVRATDYLGNESKSVVEFSVED